MFSMFDNCIDVHHYLSYRKFERFSPLVSLLLREPLVALLGLVALALTYGLVNIPESCSLRTC